MRGWCHDPVQLSLIILLSTRRYLLPHSNRKAMIRGFMMIDQMPDQDVPESAGLAESRE